MAFMHPGIRCSAESYDKSKQFSSIENVGHIDSRSMCHCCYKAAYSKESNVAKRERMAAHTDPEKGKKEKKR